MLNYIVIWITLIKLSLQLVNSEYFNLVLEKQNVNSVNPPKTDQGNQLPFKYPFSLANRRLYNGGWKRQVTQRELPISRSMAGVQMRLVQGGVRELHWHVETEWAYVIYGQCRITAVGEGGQAFVDDVGPGDLWLFPGGVPHSLQGIGKSGCFFVLVFDDGNFSSGNTFELVDLLRHVPPQVLGKNFQTNPDIFNLLPKNELFIFSAKLPETLDQERQYAFNQTGPVPKLFSYHSSRQMPNVTRVSGMVKIVDQRNFPVTSMAAAIVTLKPGALRELHWHPNSDEWTYFVQGKARMGVFSGPGQSRTMDFQEGDVGYIQRSLGHWIENTGDKDVLFLEVFKSPVYQDISLAQWLAHTPALLVNEHIRTGYQFINNIEKQEMVLAPF